jgi:predicted transglutaminase-like cysteine proteinase
MIARPKEILGAACAAAALAAVLGLAPALAAGERPLFISVGITARAPIGWIEFCAEHARECDTKPVEARDVVLTAKAWKDLVRINKWVNDTVKPITDLEHWGVVERWSYPDDGYGDCEDYVLLKRRMLMQSGWPRQALLITVVRQARRRPRGAHRQDRQGRVRPRQSERGDPALVGDRLPLREAAVAERSEQLGGARRSAPGQFHCHVPLKLSV